MIRNNWKLYFVLLISFNIVAIFLIIYFIILPADDSSIMINELKNNKDNAYFSIETNKSDLNKVINDFIEREATNKYKVYLTDDVELYGFLPIFHKNIEIKLTFEPKVLENGDLILETKNFTIGQLQIPNTYILKMIKENYNLPNWIIIQPNAQEVYVGVSKIKMKNDLRIKVDQFNLKNNDIRFILILPT